MHRRTCLATAAAGLSSIAGCAGLLGDDAAVSERVRDDGVYPFEAEPGDEIEVELDLQEGALAVFSVNDPRDEELLAGETDNQDTWTATAEAAGTHQAFVSTDGVVDLTVRVES